MISLIEFVSICGVATVTAAGASQGLHLLRRSRKHRSDQHSPPVPDESPGRPAAGAWHEPRYGKRHAVICQIEYVLGTTRHEGMLVDMSQRGWRAQGRQPVPKGSTMMVHILTDPIHGITIEEALVRWTDGLEFGVEVMRISPDSAARLSAFLSTHYPAETPSPAYALSPFSYN